jgi:hypothetical protein
MHCNVIALDDDGKLEMFEPRVDFNPIEARNWRSLHESVIGVLGMLNGIHNPRVTFVSCFENVLISGNEEDGFNLVDNDIVEVLRQWREFGFLGLIAAEMLFDIDEMADFLADTGIIFNPAVGRVDRIDMTSFDGRERFITENGCAYVDCTSIEEDGTEGMTTIGSGKIIESLSAVNLFPKSDLLVFIGREHGDLQSVAESCSNITNFVLPLLYRGIDA